MAKRKAKVSVDRAAALREFRKIFKEKYVPLIEEAIAAEGLEKVLRRRPLVFTKVVGDQIFALVVQRKQPRKAKKDGRRAGRKRGG